MAVGMFESFVTGHWFDEEAKNEWSDVATLQAWLDVEAALAGAQAQLGVIPDDAARTIAAKADARLFDLERLSEEIAFASHPLTPVLHRFEELCAEPAAGFIHWGATTQNIFDTACSLQMLRTHRLVMSRLDAAIAALGKLASTHQSTPMAGRTHGQHALPMTLGFKLAGWMDELHRDRQRLQQRVASSFVASMGGAIGTFAASGSTGRRVEALLAERLGLQPAGMLLRASFDRVTDYVNALGQLAATAQKLAQDVVFMQRTEIGEVSEAFHMGKVGSSTMAQKRNPSGALLLISLARMLRARVPLALECMVRMDEGDSSATNVSDTLLPEIAILGTSVATGLKQLASGLVVDEAALRRNLECSQGLISTEAVMMALSERMGRHEAHRVLYQVAQQAQTDRVPFADALRAHPLIGDRDLADRLGSLLEPGAYLGESAALTVETVGRVGAQAEASAR